MEILNHVDQLEALATSAGRVPKTRKVIIDLDKVLQIVDQMRLDIPKDIQEAEVVIDKREALLNQSLLDARRMKAAAEEESRLKVGESEITEGARQQAEEILAEAKQRADALVQDAQRKAHSTMQDAQAFGEGRVNEADAWSFETLKELEQHLSMVLNSVRRGLDSLEQGQAARAASAVGTHS